MGRAPCSVVTELGLRKGAWTAEEDQKLVAFIEKNKGHGSWRTLPRLAGLQRCGKSCRLRWTNYLRPNIKRGKFSVEEEQTITRLHALLGNKWSSIASHLAGRTDNEVKNYWNTHIKKRLTRFGIDPATHRPLNAAYTLDRTAGILSVQNDHKTRVRHVTAPLPDKSYFSHMAQWEVARLEAEARLAVTSTSSSARSRPTAKPSPSDAVSAVSSLVTNSATSACSSHEYARVQTHGSNIDRIQQVLHKPQSSVAVSCAAENSVSPCFHMTSKPSVHTRRENELQSGCRSEGSSGCCPATENSESTSKLKDSTSTPHTDLMAAEQLMMMLSCGPQAQDEVSLSELFMAPPSPDQSCGSGPAYWAHLLSHAVPVQALHQQLV